MYRIPGAFSTAATTQAPAVRGAEPTQRIAQRLNDVVAGPLATAGLDLQAALGLIGDHPASSRIRHAVAELDQAIQAIHAVRDTLPDHPAGQRPPP
jgi:hypothetical protein